MAKAKTKSTKTSLKLSVKGTLAQRKAEAAKAAGVNPEAVSTVQLDIETMRRLGILVDISVHGLSMLTTQASWAELGIPEGDIRRERLKRGSKDLLPSEYVRRLRSLDSRFRISLDRHSFVLEGFRPYRWVPFTAYDEWKREWAELQDEWEAVKAEILAEYDSFVDAINDDLAKIALEAWDSMTARYRVNGGSDVALVWGRATFESMADFAAYVVERGNKMPSKQDLETNLYVDYRTALVLSGADVEAEAARQARAQAEQSKAWEKQQRATERALQAKDETRKKQRLAQIELDEAQKEAQARLEAEQRRLRAMHEAEMEHARRQLVQTISPFQEVFGQLRAQIHQDVAEIAGSIEKNGHLRGKVAERARNLVDTFQLLNAHGDQQLEAALHELSSQLAARPGGAEGQRYDTEAVLNQLRAIGDMTHEAAMDVARRAAASTRAGALEL